MLLARRETSNVMITALKNGTGGLDAKTIARLCEVLDCQPGDLMEYVKEPSASVQENN